jgi:hypothetical protein
MYRGPGTADMTANHRSGSRSPAADGYGAHAYGLTAIGSGAVDVVAAAGGLLSDLARSGWRVEALIADGRDERALDIVGVQAHGLMTDISCLGGVRGNHVLAVSADVVHSDSRVCQVVREILDRGVIDVVFWGDITLAGVGHRTNCVPYRLSGAARRFKALALAAAGAPEGEVAATEALFVPAATKCVPLETHLLAM